MRVLMLGSAPMAATAARWPRGPFDLVLAINNAWRIRSDWDVAIHPHDFPEERQAVAGPGQRIVTETEFVPAQNAYGGFVYAGATMAFTAAYWALHALRPSVIAVYGCDMHYPKAGPTHFYGTGTPDPLRQDVTLRCLEAKAARLMLLAARQGAVAAGLPAGLARLGHGRGAGSRRQRAGRGGAAAGVSAGLCRALGALLGSGGAVRCGCA